MEFDGPRRCRRKPVRPHRPLGLGSPERLRDLRSVPGSIFDCLVPGVEARWTYRRYADGTWPMPKR
jgi:hypothetical protein